MRVSPLIAGLLLGLTVPRAHGQPALAAPEAELPPPRVAEAAPPPAALPDGTPVEPITLPVALRLAQANNLDIATARAALDQARAVRELARSSFLPDLLITSTYIDHEGRLQRAGGDIINRNRDSLLVAGGPSVSLPLADALFTALAARQVVAAGEAGLARVTNDTLLAVADAYLDVLLARRRLARVVETLEFLTADRPAAARADSKGLLPLVTDIVEVGGKAAFSSDVERVRVEIFRRRDEVARALQELRVAAAELARLLHLDPAVLLWPADDFRRPLNLPGEEWQRQGVEQLVMFGLANRPELAENQALVRAALDRLRAAQWRPLLPTASVGYLSGGFGGGPLVTGIDPFTREEILTGSGAIRNFGHRADFEATLTWRLDNFGLGNRAQVRAGRAAHDQAVFRLVQAQDRVMAQVVQADEQVRRGRERVGITRAALFDPEGDPAGPAYRSIRLNFERIRAAEARPLEVLDAIRGLNDLLDAYAVDLTDYDRARFRLLVALGIPARGFVDPAALPAPPACPPAQP